MKKILFISLFVCLAFSQYNPELSKSLCELTVASYCRPTKLLDWSCNACKNSNLAIQNVSLFINSTKATLGFIAYSKKLDSIGKFFINLVLVFRGTEPWLVKNWISDIDFIAINYPLCDNSMFFHIQNVRFMKDSITLIPIFILK